MSQYLQSRRDRPLHLTAWIADRAEYQDVSWVRGSARSICGRVDDGWSFTGPWAENWRPRPICRDCLRVLRRLTYDAGDES